MGVKNIFFLNEDSKKVTVHLGELHNADSIVAN